MKFSFFAAEVKANFEAFRQCFIEGWCRWSVVSLPQRSNPYRSGMPVEMIGFSDGGFCEGFVEEPVQGVAGSSHAPSFVIRAPDGNGLRNFLIMRSRFETLLDLGLGWLFACAVALSDPPPLKDGRRCS